MLLFSNYRFISIKWANHTLIAKRLGNRCNKLKVKDITTILIKDWRPINRGVRVNLDY